VTLAPLVQVLSNQLFEQLMGLVITQIDKSKKPETYISTVGVISRAAGVRVGAYLPKILPKLEFFCKLDQKKSADENAKMHELWENSLHVRRRCTCRACPYSARFLGKVSETLVPRSALYHSQFLGLRFADSPLPVSADQMDSEHSAAGHAVHAIRPVGG
jgi:hypothetical protein